MADIPNEDQLEALKSILIVYLPADLTNHVLKRVMYHSKAAVVSKIQRGLHIDGYHVYLDRTCGEINRRMYYMLTSPLIAEVDPRMILYETRTLNRYASNRLLMIGLRFSVSLSKMIASAFGVDFESENEYTDSDGYLEDDDTIN